MTATSRFVCVLPKLAYAALLPLASHAGAASEGEAAGPARINVAYSLQAFADSDTDEARQIARVWSDRILRRQFGEGASRTLIVQDAASLEAAWRRKEIDVAAITAAEYVALGSRVPMQPAFVSVDAGGVYQSAVLLVRKDAGIRTLRDLKGGRFSSAMGHANSVYQKWLEFLTMGEGYRTAEAFFSKVSVVKGPTQAILSVFFGQSDACLTTMQAFHVASELNPQVGTELIPLVQSPEGAAGMVVFRPDLDEADKRRLSDTLGTLHLDPEGRQLLGLFRMNRMVPFKTEYVESVDALQKAHAALARRLTQWGAK